ncbi:hypothetical protein PC9H_003115 [Pleurotus ostreatus]|uniref:Rab-GAP TBC domain-containing protein n=1 Tax=Pleurotus ostreatus TaxID=5322 RepID=A0A8H7A1R2_PLEOS|nr:uncharacterized protein PC9H_003115 [Pleurotus ostreatus]KAF7436286.1 hypothetical protein PC9H_003115 [Pleurotus ostreatus]KAJ8701953.1 hypothetical protein PTI98_000703 [Pleurotus ostreatus]
MESPELVLLPPTPLKFSHSSNRTTPSPVSTASSSRVSKVEDRLSSETTIFTIYSMYGEDDHAGKATARWSASAHPETINDQKPSDSVLSPSPHLPTINNSMSPRRSLPQSERYLSTELAYFDPDSPKVPPPRTSSLGKLPALSVPNTPLPYSPGGLAAGAQARRPASYDPSSHPEPLSYGERTSIGQTFRTSEATTSSSSEPGLSSFSPSRGSSHSQESYHSGKGSSMYHTPNHELPPVPPTVFRHATPPPAISFSRPSTPPRQPSPHVLLQTPQSSPLKHPASSPSSKVSLVPSEGEDVDAFHVRSTYAQLEVSGVKGDGFDEGVERTRARVGNSRASQHLADQAIGDGSEKVRDINLKEIELLSSLDRYGFFTIPSHDRLVLLPSAPLLKRLSPIPQGPTDHPPQAKTLSSVPPPQPPVRETARIAKWQRMLQPGTRDEGQNIASWRIKPNKEHKVVERTYKGIPDRWRSAAWELLMSRFTGTGRRELERWASEYRDVMEKPSTYDIQIDLDVPRTISGHIMFRTRYGAGQRSLFHVLHCFSLHCEQCGYVQGMGPIAATLLCYFDPAHVYAALIRLHDTYQMHTIFSPGFPGLLEAIYVQERITEQMMPHVYAAFKRHMISTTSYATKWYITLFANSVPFQTQLRLWDVFLLEGHDVFIAVSVAIVWVYRDHITSSAANFETVLSLLSSFFVPEDENALLLWIGKVLGDKRLRANIRKWRAEWQELVKTGKDSTALL